MKLNYAEQGSGDAVILLHGMFGSLSNLGVVARTLVDRYRVISVDLRNHGESPHAAVMSLSTMAADIVELMDDLGLSRAILIGHSLGGKIAMQVALTNPERVDALVVADIAPVTYQNNENPALVGLVRLSQTALENRSAADSLMANYVEDAVTRGFLLKNLYRTSDGNFGLKLNVPAIVDNYGTELVAAPLGDSYNGPTLFLKGETSAYIQAKHEPIIRKMFPRCQLSVVAGAGHWLHAEQPDAVTRLIATFLTANH